MNGSFAAPAAMVLVLVILRFGLLRPLHGYLLFMALWTAGGLVSTALAVRALRADGGWVPHAVVAAVLLGGLIVAAIGSRAPAIHDVTTAPEDPPEFVQAATLPANAGRDLSYPDGPDDTPEIQRRSYPDVASLQLPVTAERAHEQALEVARELGWQITWSHRPSGRFEAVATSTLFRFADDVAVRVRSRSGGCTVDVRSTSRVGRSDLGANAERIRTFLDRLRRRVDTAAGDR